MQTTASNQLSDFLDTQLLVCYSKFLAAHEKSGELDEKKIKSVRHYSFGWNGCQYTFGRVSYSLLL